MKKKKPGKYLKFYYECMQSGMIKDAPDEPWVRGRGGLCNTICGEHMHFFEPLIDDDYTPGTNFWAADLVFWDPNKMYRFTELRQTIVLFIAAMNNEL